MRKRSEIGEVDEYPIPAWLMAAFDEVSAESAPLVAKKPFDETKVKRDKDGKFAEKEGRGGTEAEAEKGTKPSVKELRDVFGKLISESKPKGVGLNVKPDWKAAVKASRDWRKTNPAWMKASIGVPSFEMLAGEIDARREEIGDAAFKEENIQAIEDIRDLLASEYGIPSDLGLESGTPPEICAFFSQHILRAVEHTATRNPEAMEAIREYAQDQNLAFIMDRNRFTMVGGIAVILGGAPAFFVPYAVHATPNNGGLFIGTSQMGDISPKRWREIGQTQQSEASTPWQVVLHEMGHFAHYATNKKLRDVRTKATFEKEQDRQQNWGLNQIQYQTIDKWRMRGHLSSYGATIPVEFVAETFTRAMLGRPIDDDMLAMYYHLEGGPLPEQYKAREHVASWVAKES